MNEKDIVDTFRAQFAFLKKEPLILYGLGEKTKLILDNLFEFNFVGLMDKNSIGCKVYSLPVFSPAEAVQHSKYIIIVSSYSSVNVIYQRIVHLKENGIIIYYMNGELLDYAIADEQDTVQQDNEVENLQKAILENDIISFDIFDTLIVRKTLYPSDVFLIVERKIREDYNMDLNFSSKRIEAEKIVHNKEKNYDLNAIYRELQTISSLDNDTMNMIKNLEIDTEIKCALPRRDISDAVNFALENGKEVIFTSDMYLSGFTLQKIIDKCLIKYKSYTINVSCELKKSKYAGDIFCYYRELYKNKKIMHIGDDLFSDIQQAKEYDITAFKVSSPDQIINSPTWNSLKQGGGGTVDDRLIFGNFICHCFSNAFFPANKKRVINDIREIGYIFFGHLILNYITWLIRLSKEHNLDKLLFISRDGYIIKKIYQNITTQKCTGIYFLTSRRSIGVCSIKKENDIIDVFNIYYSPRRITLKQFLEASFGITADENNAELYINTVSKEALLDYILEYYTDSIIRNADEERREYLKYSSDCNINPGEKIGVINLFGTGVTQYFFTKLFKDNKINFYYFATSIDFKNIIASLDENTIFSLYGEYISPYTSNNALSRHYLMMESVFSAPNGQFVRFKNGKPQYLPGEYDFSQMTLCHQGIEAFFEDMIKMDKNIFSRNFCSADIERLFASLFNANLFHVPENIKSCFKITDSFAQGNELQGLW